MRQPPGDYLVRTYLYSLHTLYQNVLRYRWTGYQGEPPAVAISGHERQLIVASRGCDRTSTCEYIASTSPRIGISLTGIRCRLSHHSALGTILSTAAIAMATSGGSKDAPAPVAEQKNIETGSK
jgi:hypothetical protein